MKECYCCGTEGIIIQEPRTVHWGKGLGFNEIYTINDEFNRCPECGEEWCDPEQMQKRDDQIAILRAAAMGITVEAYFAERAVNRTKRRKHK